MEHFKTVSMACGTMGYRSKANLKMFFTGATLISHTIGAARSFGTPRHYPTAERLYVHCSAHGLEAGTSFSIQVSPTVLLRVLLTTHSLGQTWIALTPCLVKLSA
jgi:hypothetical protein